MQKIILFLFLVSVSLFAQTDDEEKSAFGITFSGFVNTDIMIDSRQTVTARDGDFLLYPAKEALDVDGKDINAVPTFNILSIRTRIRSTITTPDVLGAKTSGVIEGSFFGHSNIDLNGFRLRHAFLKLAWDNSSLLIGQYWHPMFIVEVFPGTISFNTGVPFQPFARNPQIRYTHRFNNLHVSATALTQADFQSTGPVGASTSYLRNSGMPVLDLTVKYKSKSLVAGAGANYKTLLPSTKDVSASDDLYRSDAKIISMSAMGFVKVTMSDFTIKAEGIYGQNLTDLVMLGGYAVSDTTSDGNNFATEYTNVKTMSVWTDLVYGKKLKFGLFAGYTENLGADNNIVGATYSRGSDIASVMRVSPRIQYSIGKTMFAAEFEYTASEYGTPDIKGIVKDTTSVANLRVLLAAFLFF